MIQALIIQKPGKCRGPNFPPADVFMTIHTTSQILLTVVEMENTQLLKSYHTAKLFHGLTIFRFPSDVIAGRKDMTGIPTDKNPLRMTRSSQNVAQMFESIADTGSLASRCFQGDGNIALAAPFVNLIDGLSDPSNSGSLSLSHMGAGMSD